MFSSVDTSSSVPETVISSWSDDDNRAVDPSTDDVTRTLARSTTCWNDLASKSHAIRMTHDTVQLTTLLHRTPALPDDLHGVEQIRGYASWTRVSSECRGSSASSLDGEERFWWLMLPSMRPTFCSMTRQDDYFSFEGTELNGVSVLFFAWTYILSASLLERRRVEFEYIDLPRTSTWKSRPMAQAKRNGTVEVYIGDATAVGLTTVSKDNVASKQAMSDIFRWAALDMEPSGKAIYSHRWVRALADMAFFDGPDITNEASSSPVLTADHPQRVQEWVQSLAD